MFTLMVTSNDGFFEIEGTIIDKKSYDIPKSDGTVLRAGRTSS